jgi:EmrB/QacA subfamily drug resistance transporter
MGELSAERKLNIMIWVVALGFLMQSLDTTIVNTALPSIALSLGENPLRMQAIVFSYSLTTAVMIPASGWLADKFGTQKMYLLAICLFVLGSLLCAISWNMRFLVCSRAIQGIGGSMLLPVGRLAVMRNFKGDRFLTSLNFVSIYGLIGPLLGPTLGGWLSQAFSWRWIFFINIPFGIAGIIATVVFMPNDRLEDMVRFDLFGYVLLAFSMILSSLSFSWIDLGLSYAVAAMFAGSGAIALFSYVRHAKSAPCPIFDLRMFRVRCFSVGLSGNMFARIGNGAMPYLLPLLMQTFMGYSPSKAGILMLPSTISSIIARQPAPYLIGHFGYRRVLAVNTILVGIAIMSFGLISETTPMWALIVLQFIFGGVNSIQFTAMNTVTLKDLPERDASGGSSALSMVQQLSTSIAVVLASLILGFFQSALGGDELSHAFHATFILMGTVTLFSTTIFRRLRKED